MGFKISACDALTDSVTFDVKGLGTLEVTYKSTGYSYGVAIQAQDELASATSEAAKRDISIQALLKLVVGWDLLEDDGTPAAVTLETLNKLPVKVVTLIINASRKTADNPRACNSSGWSIVRLRLG
jgi:hypothetical protein